MTRLVIKLVSEDAQGGVNYVERSMSHQALASLRKSDRARVLVQELSLLENMLLAGKVQHEHDA